MAARFGQKVKAQTSDRYLVLLYQFRFVLLNFSRSIRNVESGHFRAKIQKTFLDATSFYLQYSDYPSEMGLLAEALAQHYDQVIEILVDSPAEMVNWSANVDEMVTHPPYFEKEIMPWCQKAVEALHAKGKLLLMHPDGENKGLMDLIPRCNMDVAEAVAPYPMTKVTLAEYYDRWCRSGKLTLWGGIPETLLLEKSATAAELDDFLDEMFKVIPPGNRFIAGIGDTSPPATDFQRLVHIGERFEKEGRLPLEAGSYRPLSRTQLDKAAALTGGTPASANELAEKSVPGQAGFFEILIQDVLKGDHLKIVEDVRAMVDEGLDPKELINKGMLPAMEDIGAKFRDGTVFIPEVLKSARAMNVAVEFLEPHLASGDQQSHGKILIGTVKGDMHDIGKNMVTAMLKGVGFDLIDIGVNVPVDEFVAQVQKHRPDILGLSALLTTTMPQMEEVIRTLSKAGIRDSLKIMVGGAPVNEKFAIDIGADGYAVDAGEAVEVAKSLLHIN
jgi:5-methyltetrahydrofolate--homocysteine methyltransferase